MQAGTSHRRMFFDVILGNWVLGGGRHFFSIPLKADSEYGRRGSVNKNATRTNTIRWLLNVCFQPVGSRIAQNLVTDNNSP